MDEKKIYLNVGLIIGIMIGVLISIIVVVNYDLFIYPEEVMIPNDDMVNTFCRDYGFRFGWVSSSCGINEVMCSRDVGSLTENKCIEWIRSTEETRK